MINNMTSTDTPQIPSTDTKTSTELEVLIIAVTKTKNQYAPLIPLFQPYPVLANLSAKLETSLTQVESNLTSLLEQEQLIQLTRSLFISLNGAPGILTDSVAKLETSVQSSLQSVVLIKRLLPDLCDGIKKMTEGGLQHLLSSRGRWAELCPLVKPLFDTCDELTRLAREE